MKMAAVLVVLLAACGGDGVDVSDLNPCERVAKMANDCLQAVDCGFYSSAGAIQLCTTRKNNPAPGANPCEGEALQNATEIVDSCPSGRFNKLGMCYECGP